MNEEWKPIPGFEGYEVSNLGNVRSYRKFGKHRGFNKSPRPKKASRSSTGCMTLVIKDLGEGNKCYAFKMHRLVYELFIGPIPSNMEIDHIDRNPINNNVSNLRLATRSQNLANKVVENATGFKGVWMDKRMPEGTRKFTAMIKVQGKKKYLGSFVTSIEAALAYNQAAINYFGEFALINIV